MFDIVPTFTDQNVGTKPRANHLGSLVLVGLAVGALAAVVTCVLSPVLTAILPHRPPGTYRSVLGRSRVLARCSWLRFYQPLAWPWEPVSRLRERPIWNRMKHRGNSARPTHRVVLVRHTSWARLRGPMHGSRRSASESLGGRWFKMRGLGGRQSAKAATTA